jgi:hypothetical protein
MAYNPKSITNKSVHCTLSKMVVSWFVFLKYVQHPISAVDCCTFAHSNSILIMLDTRREVPGHGCWQSIVQNSFVLLCLD